MPRKMAPKTVAKKEVLMSLLKQYRLAKGLTLEQAAGLLGVNANTFQAWETGRNMPRPRMYPKIASVLGLNPVDLIRVISATAGDPVSVPGVV